MKKSCCFIAPVESCVDDMTIELKNQLEAKIGELIASGIDCFMFSRQSVFEAIAYNKIRQLKSKKVKTIFYNNYKQTMNLKFKDLKTMSLATMGKMFFDELKSFNFAKDEVAQIFKAMIDDCDFCVIYYDFEDVDAAVIRL